MTQVSDDVDELNSGAITVQQLGERWAARKWEPVSPSLGLQDSVAIAELEPDDFFGPDGSWSEVDRLVARGALKQHDYFAVSKIIDSEKLKAKMSATKPPEAGHRHPNKIELSAGTNFTLMQGAWEGQLARLISAWDDIKKQQIEDLQSQIQGAVDNGSVEQVASVTTKITGDDLILEHMMKMMEDSVVLAKQEAESQGVKLPTIDTTEVARSIGRQSTAIGQIMARSISNSAATQALTRYGVDELSGADVAEAVGEHLAELSPTYASDMLGGALTQAQNQGRIVVFEQSPGTYYSSELLDKNTCINCESVDGTHYTTLDDAEADYPTGGYSECLGGPRCRGTIVAVFTEASSASDDSNDDDDDSSADS